VHTVGLHNLANGSVQSLGNNRWEVTPSVDLLATEQDGQIGIINDEYITVSRHRFTVPEDQNVSIDIPEMIGQVGWHLLRDTGGELLQENVVASYKVNTSNYDEYNVSLETGN
jgi:hypothetical protein